MKIVLVGYMASGKSSVGQLLANTLHLDYVDLDAVIEENMSMSISEIFSQRGEIFFRRKEYETLQQVLKSDKDMVLSTGGGTPCYGNNMQSIINYADVSIYLQLSIPNLVGRISIEKDTRPLVKNISDDDLPEFIGKHLFERRNFYMQATNTIECDNKTVAEIVGEIQKILS